MVFALLGLVYNCWLIYNVDTSQLNFLKILSLVNVFILSLYVMNIL